MTSQQLRYKLSAAIGIIAECERYLDNPEADVLGWEATILRNRIRSFMDIHRDELRERGEP